MSSNQQSDAFLERDVVYDPGVGAPRAGSPSAAPAVAGLAVATATLPADLDLVCLSHLRWDFVYQRPQHLLTRFADERRVFYVEEPVFVEGASPEMRVVDGPGRLRVATPQLPHGLDADQVQAALRALVSELFYDHGIERFALWYYTPMAVPFTAHLDPDLVVFDCMDQLSAFAGAPPELVQRERDLLRRADVVFTGGRSLYEAKRHDHHNVHCFPSSIDARHFAKARAAMADPADQAAIPHPRIGFYGVIDERFDIGLLAAVAAARPDLHFPIIGPVVKIDPASLPRLPNIHYLGGKGYAELPAYLAGWDAAMLPFARNQATRYISPTKTPEYLAAGRPVVSTPIEDVVTTYGARGLAHIAGDPGGFAAAIDAALAQRHDQAWLERVDRALAADSWDRTWNAMKSQMAQSLALHP